MEHSVTIEGADIVGAILGATAGELKARQRLNKVAGEGAARLVRDHLMQRNRSVDRDPGWEPSNYWANAAESAYSSSDADGATVHIPWAGVRWHRYGGTIEPRNAKALAIPLRPENKGVYPSKKFPNRGDAFVYRPKSGDKAFLATSDNGKLTLHYILLKSVSKDPDPTVLPSDDDILAAAVAPAQKLINSILSKN